jgi:hypothetical protein
MGPGVEKLFRFRTEAPPLRRLPGACKGAPMTFPEAIALLPRWVNYWLYVLVFGGLVLPFTLFIWRQSRLAALAVLAADAIAALGVAWLFNRLGYVKLLGLPHLVAWGPLEVFLFLQIKRPGMPNWPRRIMIVILATLLVSLAFDLTDVVRYLLGERTPLAKPV